MLLRINDVRYDGSAFVWICVSLCAFRRQKWNERTHKGHLAVLFFHFFFACFHTFIYTSHHKMNRIDMNILFERYIQCFNHKVNKLVSLGRAIRTLVAYSTTFGISITVCVNEFFVNFLRETPLYWWKRMSGDSGVFHKCSLLEMFWIFECWNINSWILATRTHKYTRILSHVNRIQFCRNIKKRKKSKSNSFNSLLKHWFLCVLSRWPQAL